MGEAGSGEIEVALELPIVRIAAFVGESPSSGNMASVVRLESMLSDEVLLALARRNGDSETAYLLPEGDDRWQLRWFTPGLEVDLCGHATLKLGLIRDWRRAIISSRNLSPGVPSPLTPSLASSPSTLPTMVVSHSTFPSTPPASQKPRKGCSLPLASSGQTYALFTALAI